MNDPTTGQAKYNPRVPNVARMYDYFLGGKDHLPVDRAAAEEAIAWVPEVPVMARENRKYLHRVVTRFVELGIRQFIDIGSGLPTLANTHQIAQDLEPDTRVVYVDNDPLVLAHAQALLATNGNTTVITADLRRPDEIIDHPGLKEMIDWSQPVAILLIAVLHFIPDSADPYGIIAKLHQAIAPGSYLALSHAEWNENMGNAAKVYDQANSPGVPRKREDIERLLSGFELIAPGLVPVTKWRPNLETGKDTIPFLGGVGRKPLSPLKYVDLLSAALLKRDLNVKVNEDLVTAKNADIVEQDVKLCDTDEGPTWAWVWPGPRSLDGTQPEPEIEPFCPAGDIDRAARQIANVVSGRVEELPDA